MRKAAVNLSVSGGVASKSIHECRCARWLLILGCLVV
jgi:hypothetical protein